MDSALRCEITAFGFNFGAMEVTRVGEIRGAAYIHVKTPYRELQIYAFPTGRSLRVFDYGKGEMKLIENDGEA